MRSRARTLLTSTLVVSAVGVLTMSPVSAGVSPNLIANPGAETGGVTPWINFSTGWSASSSTPVAGGYSFVPTEVGDNVQMYQVISLTEFATDIAAGTATAEFGGAGATGDGALVGDSLCKVTLSLGFRTAANDPTANQIDLVIANAGVHSGQSSFVVPPNTDHVEVWVGGRNIDFPESQIQGCNLQADDLYFRINGPSVAGLPPTGLAPFARTLGLAGAALLAVGFIAVIAGRRSRRLA